MKVNYPYVIMVDWLSLYLKATLPIIDKVGEKIEYYSLKDRCTYIYKLEPTNYGTAVYEHRCTLQIQKRNQLYRIGTLLFKPKSSILPSTAAQFTFTNQELYTSSWLWDIAFLSEVLGLQYKSITRIDLAHDCNKFKNGLLPQTLIGRYLKGDFLKIGNNSPTVNFTTLGYTINRPAGEKDNGAALPIKVQQVEFKDKEVNAVTWGTHSSGVQTQLYNKSLELKTNYKPWIYDTWERAGLDPTSVWRCEVRIQGNGKDLLRLDDNSMFGLNINDIMDEDAIERLFYAYALKYMRFVKRDYHAKKQHMKPVPLFCMHQEPTVKPKFNKMPVSHSRTIKTVTNLVDLLIYYIEQGVIIPRDAGLSIQYLKSINYEIKRNFITPYNMGETSIQRLKQQYADMLQSITNQQARNRLANLFNQDAFNVPSSSSKNPRKSS